MKNLIKYFILLISIFLIVFISASIFKYNDNDEIILGDSYLLGDVDNNGKVGASDYILVRKHILKTSLLNGEKLKKADVNNDGKINAQDYIRIRKIILNGEKIEVTSTPTATPTTTPNPVVRSTTYKKQFEITHFWGIFAEYMDNTQIEYLRDAGFTLIWVMSDKANHTSERYKKEVSGALERLNNYGLRAIVLPEANLVHPTDPSETQEDINKRVRQMIEDYSKYSNVVEYFVTDEPPSKDCFETIGKTLDLIHELDPGREGYVNLLQKGSTSGNYKDNYLIPYAKYANTPNISFDKYIYPLGGGVDKPSYYDNLQDIYTVSRDYDKIPTAIVLLTQHGDNIKVKNITRNEIAFEVSVAIAFGMKRISYFTYSIDGLPSDYKHAFLDENHNRTQHYYDVQSVNKWLIKLGNQLFDKEMVGVFGFNESSLPNYNTYSSGIVATKDGIISMFSDKSYMLVNTKIVSPGENTFTFASMSGLSYFNTDTGKWDSITGDISTDNFSISYNKKQITIKAGYCILLKGGDYWKRNSLDNWKKDSSDKWHYYDPDGNHIKSEWVKFEGEWFYLDDDGVMTTSWKQITVSDNTDWYYFNDKGVLQFGWLEWNKHWYYLDPSTGALKMGWQKLGDKWYYLDPANDGIAIINTCKTIDNVYYCFDADGACYTKGC